MRIAHRSEEVDDTDVAAERGFCRLLSHDSEAVCACQPTGGVKERATCKSRAAHDNIMLTQWFMSDMSTYTSVQRRLAGRACLPSPVNPEPLAGVLTDDVFEKSVDALRVLGRIA